MIIVTRHRGLVDWLSCKGITGLVKAHVDGNDVVRRDVIGVLPLSLAALADSVTTVDLPYVPQDRRGTDLTAEEMDLYGARLVTYRVYAINTPNWGQR